MNSHLSVRLVVAAFLTAACPTSVSLVAQAPAQRSSDASQTARQNPLLSESRLAYGAPDFSVIQDTDYEPALRQGMAEQLQDVQRIAGNAAAPTFENTIEALERSGSLLTRVNRIFSALVQANTNPTLRAANVVLAPAFSAHRDSIALNMEVFARIERLYDQRTSLGLAADQVRAVERYFRDGVRAGVLLSPDQKATLRELNREQSELTTSFRNKVLADANAASPVFDSTALLDGLSQDDVAAAANAASGRGLTSRWVLRLQNTTQQPLFSSLNDRQVRRQIFQVSTSRNSAGDNDTTALIARLAVLRAERARLLGYDSHAAFTLDNQMAKTPQAALKLMTDMVPAVARRVNAEATRMQQLIDRQAGGFALEPWDWAYYAEQVRKADRSEERRVGKECA